MAKKLPDPIIAKELVEIYVPSECRCGQPLPEAKRQEVLDEVIDKLTEWFPGATRQKTSAEIKKVGGYWKLVDGSRADEKNDLVYANCTEDELEEHFSDVQQLAHDIAIRLTQEVGACRINGEFFGYPETLKSPHRCAGELPSGALPNPVGSNEKKSKRFLQAFLGGVSSLSDITELFCNHLNYHHESAELATLDWPESLQDLLATNTLPKVIAGYNGFNIIHLQLAAEDLRKGQERQLIQRIRKDDPSLRALFVVSNYEQNQWHLINTKDTQEDSKTTLHLRFFRIGKGQQVRTAAERLHLIDIEALDSDITAQELQDHHNDAFDVESVSQDFFNEISNWYFWALSQVDFPQDTVVEGEEEKHRATSLIRFLTRIIFCWFLKEKGLIPESLFNRKELEVMLVDLDEDHCTYHEGILQNLFFATLNQRMGKDSKTGESFRAFAKDEGFANKRSTYRVDTLYRYKEHFKDEAKILGYFAEVPFLNGGLFECLDRIDDSGKKLYLDGFSRNKKKRTQIPNKLFFAPVQNDVGEYLSKVYGDTRRRNSTVRGLLNILHSYNFTVEENTPVDEEIALDPELLGKVFENLLASYNEETKTSARRQTGSFYTPRPIVEFMVDESLKGHLMGTLTKLGWEEVKAVEQLDLLLGYSNAGLPFSYDETNALLEAIHNCKILDPACGSGAFPMGMLQKLVHVVQKLDPENDMFEDVLLREVRKETEDRDIRRRKIEQIGKDFLENNVDYVRKLYLIEHCLYGVDIQPIAIQISKLRIFISLICDQKISKDKMKNHGVRALPNLETKFVAANTLAGLPEMDQMALVDPRVNQIEDEIGSLYHRHFSIQRRDQKLRIQKKLKELRKELGQVLAESLGTSQKAKHLAEWDPFDSQVSSAFFDPYWMFGKTLNRGFDIVIQNPPYISHEKIPKTLKEIIKNYDSWEPFADIYCYFLEQSNILLKEGGISCAITSNSFLRAEYGGPLRNYLIENATIRSLLSIDRSQIFESAIVNVVISIFSNEKPATKESKYLAGRGGWSTEVFADYVRDQTIVCSLSNLERSVWSLSRDSELAIVSMLEKQNPSLRQRETKIRLGLATGCNPAFLVDAVKYKSIVSKDKDTAKILKPVIKGRDVDRYKINPHKQYLILSKNGVNLPKEYPILAKHLEQFGSKFKERGAQGQNWWNLRACSFYSDFENDKIVWIELTNEPRFSVCPGGVYMLNTAYYLLPPVGIDAFALTTILNSSVAAFYMRHTAQTSGMGLTRWIKMHVSEIPIPNLEVNAHNLLSSLGRLRHNASDEVAIFTDRLIDSIVLECYFGEYMKKRNLNFIDETIKYFVEYDSSLNVAKQRQFLDTLHSSLNVPGSDFRNRLDQISTESPELLAVILK